MNKLDEYIGYISKEPFEIRADFIHHKLNVPLEQIERLRNTNKCKNLLFEDFFMANYTRLENNTLEIQNKKDDSTPNSEIDIIEYELDNDTSILNSANELISKFNMEMTLLNTKNTNRRLTIDIVTPLITFLSLVMFLLPSTPFLLKVISLSSSISLPILYFYFRFIYKIFKEKELMDFIDYKK